MKRSILTLATAAALLAGGASAAQAATVCNTIPVPAVPAVYTTTVTPAVTVTEYEFTHAQDGQGQGNGHGPVNRWEADANWNVESNPQSVGWLATGATRVRVLETERVTTTLVTPEVPAGSFVECLEMPDGVPPVPADPQDPVIQPGLPEEDAPVAPVAPAAPPAAVAYPAPAVVPVAPVAAAQEVPVANVEALPKELAYTGANDWVLPTGVGLLLAGASAIVLSRRLTPTK